MSHFTSNNTVAPGWGDGSISGEPSVATGPPNAVALNTTSRQSNVAGDGGQPFSGVHRSYRTPVCPCPKWKRWMDIAGSLLGLATLWPVFLMVAIFTKCVSRGPVFFRQRRYGVGGRPFVVRKFRTMEVSHVPARHLTYVAALMQNGQPLKKLDHEFEIIRGGRILRQLGIDELPQLINVLKGEMSLVGPRPDVMPPSSFRQWRRRRFEVLPGITGLWQVSGKNRTTFATMMRLDMAYIRRRSFWLDVAILLRTVLAVVRN